MLLAAFLQFFGQHSLPFSTLTNVIMFKVLPNPHLLYSGKSLTSSFSEKIEAIRQGFPQPSTSKLPCLGSLPVPEVTVMVEYSGSHPTLLPSQDTCPEEQPSLSRSSTSLFLPVSSPSGFKYTSGYPILKATKRTKPTLPHTLTLSLLSLSLSLFHVTPQLVESRVHTHCPYSLLSNKLRSFGLKHTDSRHSYPICVIMGIAVNLSLSPFSQ